MQPLRRAAVCGRPAGAPPAHVARGSLRQRFQAPPLQARLDIARLRYAVRLSRHASAPLRALMEGSGGDSWRTEVRAALHTLRTVLAPRLDELPVLLGDDEPITWVLFWGQHPAAWAQLLKRLMAAAVSSPGQLEAAAVTARAMVPRAAPPIPPGIDEDDGEWVCWGCQQELGSKAQLLAHQAAAHGRRLEARRFTLDGRCPACGTHWHARLRVLQRMVRAPLCRAACQSGRLAECDPTAVAAATAGATGGSPLTGEGA